MAGRDDYDRHNYYPRRDGEHRGGSSRGYEDNGGRDGRDDRRRDEERRSGRDDRDYYRRDDRDYYRRDDDYDYRRRDYYDRRPDRYDEERRRGDDRRRPAPDEDRHPPEGRYHEGRHPDDRRYPEDREKRYPEASREDPRGYARRPRDPESPPRHPQDRRPASREEPGWAEPTSKSSAKQPPSEEGWGGSQSGGDGGWGGDEQKAPSGGDGGWGAPQSGGDGGWGGGDEQGAPSGGDGGWGEGRESSSAQGKNDDWSSAPAESSWGGGGQGNSGSGCRNCGEEGHFARECPHPPKPRDGAGGGKPCFKCGQTGHFAADCPNPEAPRPPREDNPDDECWRCGGQGHTAQTCPSRVECGNEPGKAQASKHNALYRNDYDESAKFDDDGFGDEDTERAEELFGTHSNTGIQFSKYSQIEVQVFGNDVPSPLKHFDDIDLGKVITGNLKLADWKEPTPIQRYAIPIALNGRDIMGCAQTGSGKTAAFLIPIIRKLLKRKVTHSDIPQPRALICVPVRELAQQIHIEAIKFTYRSPLRSVVCYGGSGSRDQREALERGCDILIGTPGRLIDFMLKGLFDLSKIQFLCFDEADRMIDTGFGEDMKVLTDKCPPVEQRQTLMFSATFPEDVQEMAKESLRHDHVLITVGRVGSAASTVKQVIEQVGDYDKFDRLVEILKAHPLKTLIFVGKKITAEDLKRDLSDLGSPVETIHGDKDQYRREAALEDFKKGRTKILIATDVASRGLDIPAVGHVINYDMPMNIDDYVHRIGRTGRVGHEGLATSFYADNACHIAAELVRTLEEHTNEVPEFLRIAGENNPTGARKTYASKPRRDYGGGESTGNAGGGDSWADSNAGGGDSWGNSANAGGGGDSWGNSANAGGGGDSWGNSGNAGGGDDSWGNTGEQSGQNNNDGWGGDSTPAESNNASGGGWGGDESAPAESNNASGGGWGGDDSAPAESKDASGGGWGGDDSAPAESNDASGGGWGDDSTPAESAPAESSGWGD